jgi:hypothetical protein
MRWNADCELWTDKQIAIYDATVLPGTEEYHESIASATKAYRPKQIKLKRWNIPVHAMKTYGKVEVKLRSFLLLEVDRNEWGQLHARAAHLPVSIEQTTQWAPESVWTLCGR